jgi:PAS domain S-box-containing protein
MKGRKEERMPSQATPAESGRGIGAPSATPAIDGQDAGARLLIEAGAVLTSTLDMRTTIGRVASLTVPILADLCVIDLRDDLGAIAGVAVVAEDPAIAAELEELRLRFPLDPDGEHPVARVIRSGEPELLPEMSPGQLRAFAQGSEHARFMLERDYRSALVAPLQVRGGTLGALSALRLGERAPFSQSDLDLLCELARRAASAIENARLFSELSAAERRQDAILAGLAEAITVVDREGKLIFANQAAADLLKVASPEDLVRAPMESIAARFLLLDESGRELELEEMPGQRLLAGESPEPLLVRNIVRATGEERWLIVRSSPIMDPDNGEAAFAVNVYENITAVKRTQLAEAFMSQASRVLASSMDYAETLSRVARLAVPALADWCAIDLLDERGEIRSVAVHHADPDKVALAERLLSAHPHDADGPTGVPKVIRSSETSLYPDMRPEFLEAYAQGAEHLELLRAIGFRSLLIVPLMSAVRTIGAITLVTSESGRHLTSEDVGLAERLARRAGTAVENARLYTERTLIAHTLQEALLPESLPDIPGVEIEARYRAAGELNEVGGDFYDVFAHGDEWMLVIGDVVGKGARAAGVTALARHTLRAASISGRSQAGMLEMLHQALRRQPPGADLCTVCLVGLRSGPEGLRARIALAGHPPPLLMGAGGDVRQVGRMGTLLGVFDPITVHEMETGLAPGETLIMYTDGIPEAGQAEEALGERGLIELCRHHAGMDLGTLLKTIEHTALTRAEGTLGDDLALLGARVRPL